jgi:hypothetical protein
MSTENFASVLDAPAPAALSQPTRRTLAVCGAALAAGIAGDALLREMPWGLNLALFAAVFCGLSAAVTRWFPVAAEEEASHAWMAPVLALAALAAWRDSPALKALDLFALIAVLSLAAMRAQGITIRLAGIGSYVVGVALAFVDALLGAAPLLAGLRWEEVPRGRAMRHLPAVVRGLVISIPVLLLFNGLLVSADERFQRLIERLFTWDVGSTMSHVLLALALAWMAGGALRALHLVRRDPLASLPGRPDALTLGATETAMVLGLVDLLFLLFVAVQVRWFFGGAAVVASSPGLSYADYARRGFFELAVVAALVLPLLLAVHWAQRGAGRAEARLFRVLAGVQVALVFVMMASAARRIWLYQQAYGLTEARLFTSAFIAWLAVVFTWFAATVLRGRRERFAIGAVVAGLGMIAVLHAANPDALIVRVNLQRAGAAQGFDARYAARLSGDAVPALLAALPSLDPVDRCAASKLLAAQWLPAQREDWRAWSWGRSRALGSAAAHLRELRTNCDGITLPPEPVRVDD